MCQRLTAVPAIASGIYREEVADSLGIRLSRLGEWLRVFRDVGLDALRALHYRGDPGNLTPHQVERLEAEVAKGRSRDSDQIRHFIHETSSGLEDLLERVGISCHEVTGFLWKADPDEQKAFVKKCRRQKANAQRREEGHTRRSFVDARHPASGLALILSCWLLVGQ